MVFDKVWTGGSNYASAMTGIGVNSKNPERAMMVIELLNTDPYVATMMRFGLEGEHWEKDAEYNNEAILAAHMGFVLDTSPIENELSACNNAVGEYYDILVNGMCESSEAMNRMIDEMNAKLKENGVETMVAEVQRQIDAWAEGR